MTTLYRRSDRLAVAAMAWLYAWLLLGLLLAVMT